MKRAKDYLTTQVATPRWFLLLLLIVSICSAVDDVESALTFVVCFVLFGVVTYLHARHRDRKRTA